MHPWKKPMPAEAKMVFKGKIFEVWQWEQTMFDGTKRTFERLRRPDTVEIFAVVGDKIVVHDEQQPDTEPFITMPAGRVEDGEEPPFTAKRELLEETGYESYDWVLAGQEIPSGKVEWTIHVFVARNCIKKQEPMPEAGEKIMSRFVSFDELLALSDDPRFRSLSSRNLLWRARLDPEKKEELRALLWKGAAH